ncbi:MAG: type III secretion system export apparatus subunit SctS [Burkholderiaceae bacterium]
MNTDFIVEITQQALALTLWLGGPLVAAAALIGLIVSFFQAITQIQDQTLAFGFKLLVVFGLLAILGAWMGGMLVQFGDRIFDTITGIK